MSRTLTIWRDSFRSHRLAIGLLAAVALLMLLYLAFGPKPWISGVAPQEAAGEKLRPVHYVVTGLWWAAWANLGLTLSTLLLAPLLLQRLPASMPEALSVEVRGKPRAALIVGLLLAATLSGVLQAPRLSFSLWGDEEYTAKRFVAGYYRRDQQDAMELREPAWVDTAWDFRNGANNHQLFSLLSRVSHSFHQASKDPKEIYFSEEMIRLPSFLASLGTVLALGWLVALLGAPRGAVVAAFFLALHPWFLRYGPEARGYALMMLMLTLALIFLVKASSGGQWRHWIAFGMAEFLCFFSYMGSAQFILLLNLSALALVCFGQREKAARLPQFGRFLMTNLMAAGLVIIAVAPAIVPLRTWYQDKVMDNAWGGPPDLPWILDELGYLATGTPWKSWDVSNPLSLNLQELPRLLTVSLLSVVAVLLVLGVLKLLIGGRRSRLLIPALLLPGPLMVVQAVVMKNFLFPWYLLLSVPMVALFVGLGVDFLATRFRLSGGKQTMIATALAVLCLGLMVVTTRERVHLLRSQSVEPLYESVALTREVINPADPAIDRDVITVGFSMWTEGYDPAARVVKSADELRKVLDEARATGRDVYVNFGQFLLARQNTGDVMAMIEDEALFEQVAVLHGLWQPCTRWVYKAKLENP